MMQIKIEDLRFDCIVGILPFERETPQEVILYVTIDYHYTHNNFINYAEVVTLLKNSMKNEKFLLLEDALEKLAAQLKKNFQKISILNIQIIKPSIMPDCRVSVAKKYHYNS